MNLSSLTLSQLRYLLAVDEARSFRRAAEACGVSQPGLSMQLKKLEETLGGKLFDRSRQPVVPTRLGENVVRQARRVLRETERLGQLAGDAGDQVRGRYRLGIIPTLAPLVLPKLLPHFARTYPEVELHIEELETPVLVERLESDRIDGGIAATPLDTRTLKETPLYREALLAYLPKGHPLTQHTRVRQRDLVSEDVWLLREGHCFGDQVLQLCQVHRAVGGELRAQVDFRSSSFEVLTALVDAGMGVTVLPEMWTERLPARVQSNQVRPLALPQPMREVSFLQSRTDLGRAVAEALMRSLEQAIPERLRTQLKRERGTVLSPR